MKEKPHGSGICFLKSGSRCKGEFLNGERNGNGHEIFSNDEEYKGFFVDG